MLKGLLLVACALAVASGPVSAALKPDAFASNSGGGVASVSGGPWDGWRVVVTTRPSGLQVRLQVRGHRTLTARSPIVRGSSCQPRCLINVTAQLWTARGTTPPTGTLSLALYKE